MMIMKKTEKLAKERLHLIIMPVDRQKRRKKSAGYDTFILTPTVADWNACVYLEHRANHTNCYYHHSIHCWSTAL